MSDDIPTPAKGVYIFFDYIALGFVLVAIEELVRGSSWKVWVGCLALGAVFLFVGVMGSSALLGESSSGELQGKGPRAGNGWERGDDSAVDVADRSLHLGLR